METPPQQQNQSVPTTQVVPQPQTAAAPQTAKSAAAAPKTTGASGRKFVIGCLSAFGCSLILFIGVIFAFIFLGGSTENPIFSFLGVPPGEVINVLITIINLIFLFLVFVSFVLVIIGVFKRTTTKKEDSVGRKKANMFIFVSTLLLFFFIVSWVVVYLFLAPKRTTVVQASPIITQPEKTTNLKAPITIKFDASRLPINTRQFDILSYSWNFGDGESARGIKQEHTYTSLGEYVVTLTITVKEKPAGKEQTVEFTRDVTIQNVQANVVIKAQPQIGVAPLKVTLDGAGSSSANGEISDFAWDLDGDGQYDDATEAITETTFEKVGSYKVGLRVTDSTGDFSTGEIEIEATVPDVPTPVIAIDGVAGTDLRVGTAYIFSAANSTTANGTIEKYEWSLSDGARGSTRSLTHTFKEPGEYDVTLKVIDSKKKASEATIRYSVTPPSNAPRAVIKTTPNAENDVVRGESPFEVVFDASDSTDDNNNIVEYGWDFTGDSKTDDTNALTKYTFNEPNTYKVVLIVTDSTDLRDSKELMIQVTPPDLKAVLTAQPISGQVPLTVQFDASGSSYPDGEIAAFEWDFGDGSKPRLDTATVTHQYTSIGAFTVTVTAIGADNKRASTKVTVHVRPISLSACFTPSIDSGKAPLSVSFDPSCSTGSVVKYKWDFAKLKITTERRPRFIFQNAGSYEVTLQVWDNENTVDTFSKTITVNQ